MSKSRFVDPDLHTPAHDAIMVWLDANARAVVTEILLPLFQSAQRNAIRAIAEIPEGELLEPARGDYDALMAASAPDITLDAPRWEVPVKFGGGTRYIDLLIRAKCRLPCVEWEEKYGPQRRVWVKGTYKHEIEIACGVKPLIRSVGELIRQLRQYESSAERQLLFGKEVAVVSPDDRFREIIERQGFLFIKAPQPDVGPQGGLF